MRPLRVCAMNEKFNSTKQCERAIKGFDRTVSWRNGEQASAFSAENATLSE